MTMKRLKLIIVCMMTAAIVATADGQQSFAVEPDDRSAVIGTTVSLPCRVSDLAGQLQWTKDDFALGTNRNLSYHGYPRYAMTGSDGNGEFNLKVSPVTLDDDGVYQCQVGTGKRDEPAIRSRKATLTVLVPPDRPRITQGESIVTTENVPLELECVSQGGKPTAEITWTDGSGNRFDEDLIKSFSEPFPADNRRFTTRSVLRIIPTMEHHNKSIWCQAHNSAIDKKLQTKIRVNVNFAPKITLTMAGQPRKLVEGADVQFLCLTKANPPDVTYRWFVNDQFALGEVTSELWLINITRRLHNSLVRCEAQNSVDKAEESKALNIQYKPQFKTRPRNVQADARSQVSILCDVDSNPAASIKWTFEKTKRVVSTSSNLTVHVSAATTGRYLCKATTPEFGEISAEATVFMKSAPVINSPRIQHGTPTDTVRLECVASSVPVADRIVWSYQGTVIGTRNDQNYYSVLEDPTDDGVKSTLIIRNSRYEQFGVYNCTASNYYGSDSIEISLVPKRDFMLILAIFCAGVGIFVTVVVLSVVGFCRRRSSSQKKKKSKSEFGGGGGGGESDTENKQGAVAKDSDASSNVSDIKMETGTGSSLSNYRYKIDYGGAGAGNGADSMTIATTVDDRPRSTTPKSGGAGSQTALVPRGIPLAGPVPVDPRYATTTGYLGHQQNVMLHHPLSNGSVVGDYADPLTYVRYHNNSNINTSERPTSSSGSSSNNNGYIAADRLYDLNPISQKMTTSSSLDAAATTTRNGVSDPATLLQYSATYGNPYLRSNTSQWPATVTVAGGGAHVKLDAYGRPEPPPYSAAGNSNGRAKRKNVVVGNGGTTAAVGPNYHIGMAKRQTLATHV